MHKKNKSKIKKDICIYLISQVNHNKQGKLTACYLYKVDGFIDEDNLHVAVRVKGKHKVSVPFHVDDMKKMQHKNKPIYLCLTFFPQGEFAIDYDSLSEEEISIVKAAINNATREKPEFVGEK